MVTLLEIQKAADQLTGEEQADLVAHLLAAFPKIALGPDDDEIDRRETEMDTGSVIPLSHSEFLAAVGRR
jgi:hypothetical protein